MTPVNAKQINKMVQAIREALPKITANASSVTQIEEQIQMVDFWRKEREDVPTMRANFSTCVVDIPVDIAELALKSALELEIKQTEIYAWRLDKALSYLTGEYDGDFDKQPE